MTAQSLCNDQRCAENECPDGECCIGTGCRCSGVEECNTRIADYLDGRPFPDGHVHPQRENEARKTAGRRTAA